MFVMIKYVQLRSHTHLITSSNQVLIQNRYFPFLYYLYIYWMPVSKQQPAATSSSTTVEIVNRIASIPDPVARNYQITSCYHNLSSVFADRMGAVANWCTFATWASKQAGVTIRGEDLQAKIEAVLEKEPAIQDVLTLLKHHARKLNRGYLQESIAIEAIRNVAKSATERASAAVGRGNKKVFEEIAIEFARFIPNFIGDRAYNPETIDNFCKTLRVGLPPDGQDYLSNAFTNYYRALFEVDLKTRHEMILLANIQIGFHEQTRLQPEIAQSLDAANIDATVIRVHLTDLILKNKSLMTKVFYFFTWLTGGTKFFRKAVDDLVAIAERHIRKVITKHLMTLTMPPENRLNLGNDLLMPFPEYLTTITTHDLENFWKQLKPSIDARDGAGCSDWSDLSQRIFFIAHLFRCYHQTADLFAPPFSEAELLQQDGGPTR